MDTYEEQIDKELLIYTIGIIISNINEKGEFGFNESCFNKYFNDKINIYKVEQCLNYLSDKNILSFELIAEEGYYADWYINIDNNAKVINELNRCINDINKERIAEINSLKSKVENLESEKKSILNFNPDMVKEKIKEATNSISLIKKQIESNQALSSLSPVIDEMNNYIKGIDNINQIYLEVYKNIIKPIQKESKSGIKATAFWAIISIIITTIISIFITYVFK